jgi:hypothetical protein
MPSLEAAKALVLSDLGIVYSISTIFMSGNLKALTIAH